jgi:hypothetical protein
MQTPMQEMRCGDGMLRDSTQVARVAIGLMGRMRRGRRLIETILGQDSTRDQILNRSSMGSLGKQVNLGSSRLTVGCSWRVGAF